MSDTTRGYRHLVLAHCAGRKVPFLIGMRREDADRLQQQLANLSPAKESIRFFCCDTVDGKTIVLNLACLQAVHFRFETAAFAEDRKRHTGGLKVYLRDRKDPIKADIGDPDQLFTLIANLETGPGEHELYHGITDGNGEQLMINIGELVLMEAPSHIVQEGGKEIADDFEEEG